MGKQIYVSDEHHTKLKIASAQRGEDMKDIVESFIDNELEVDNEEYNGQLINTARYEQA